MPTLIKKGRGDDFAFVDDAFTAVADDQDIPRGDVIISLARFQTDGDRLLSEGRQIGVRIEPAEEVEALAYDLPRLAVVALAFPKHRDGRAFSSATVLRKRLGFTGEIRAVGDVFVEQAAHMVRCGFDAFEAAPGVTLDRWAHVVNRHRHVYQRAVDARPPAFVEREE